MRHADGVKLLTLRERTRRAVRMVIEESAWELFDKQGYEATTVGQIARTAGMSERSFFRYFASKEDLVMGVLHALGAEVTAGFRARPADEDVWVALGAALRVCCRLYDEPDSLSPRPIHDLIGASPTLSAAFQVGRANLQRELTVIARERASDSAVASPADPRLDAVVGSGLACLEAAERAWLYGPPEVEFAHLLDLALRYCSPTRGA